MRCRLIYVLVIVGTLLLASIVAAQQETATPLLPPTDTPTPAIPLNVEASDATAGDVDRAVEAADRAEESLDRAYDLLGLVQALSIFLIVFVPLLVVIAAVVILRRLQTLEKRFDDTLDTLDRQAHDLKEVEKAVGKIGRS